VEGAQGARGRSLAILSGMNREGLIEQRVEGANGANSEDLWGRSPREEREQRMWKVLCIAFLKSANAMYSRVCVCVCICVCVCVCLKTFLEFRAWYMALLFALMTSCTLGAL